MQSAKLCIHLHKHGMHEYQTCHGESTICNKMENISVCFITILCAFLASAGKFINYKLYNNYILEANYTNTVYSSI